MDERTNLGEIEKLCDQIMNSPYFRKQTPDELKQLHSVLEKVSLLISESIPPLITEVRRLRSINRKLRAEIDELGPSELRERVDLSA